MSTDREVLVALLDVVDRHADDAIPEAARALRRQANRARRHLLLATSSDAPCRDAVERASRAAYAAGQARQAGASP